MDFTEPSGRLIRWRLRLDGYIFLILHKQGLQNRQVDAVSRLESDVHATELEDLELPSFDSSVITMNEGYVTQVISIAELLREQGTDEY